jgi:hypothetical protein
MTHVDQTSNSNADTVPATAPYTVRLIACHVLARLLARQHVDPCSGEMSSFWVAINEGVEEALGELDINEVERMYEAQHKSA